MAFLQRQELEGMGFQHLGEDVRISTRAAIYGASHISVGDHSRIDDFCVLSAGAGGIEIGRNVHIAVFCSLIGAGQITMEDFSGLSSRVTIYSSNDDYSGDHLTNPAVPAIYTNVTSAPVRLGRHVIIGAGTIILPGVTLHDGGAVGAQSLVTRDCEEFAVYAGVPAKRIRDRSRKLLALERAYLESESRDSRGS